MSHQTPATTVVILGVCPPCVGAAVRTSAATIVAAGEPGRVVELLPPGRHALVLLCPGAQDAIELPSVVRELPGTVRWAVVAPREWPQAQAAVAAGACAVLIHEPGDGDGVAAAAVAALLSTVAVPAAQTDLLSPREREALAYIAAGFTHQQTARRMRVSKATVDTFVLRIRTKLGVGNKAELTRLGLPLAFPGPPVCGSGQAPGPAGAGRVIAASISAPTAAAAVCRGGMPVRSA